MLTDKQLVINAMKNYGNASAKEIQSKSDTMTGTELAEQSAFIPTFKGAIAKKNMLDRAIGFLCKSETEYICKLLQPYDSTIYTDSPEKLPAQWGYKFSTDPTKALPFIGSATSTYAIGECCTELVGDVTVVYRSNTPNNVWSPSAMPSLWEVVE